MAVPLDRVGVLEDPLQGDLMGWLLVLLFVAWLVYRARHRRVIRRSAETMAEGLAPIPPPPGRSPGRRRAGRSESVPVHVIAVPVADIRALAWLRQDGLPEDELRSLAGVALLRILDQKKVLPALPAPPEAAEVVRDETS